MLPFIHRTPTGAEINKLRLLLSTYQDGSGMLRKGLLPGWRDFERSFAAAYHGIPVEDKGVYDVLLTDEVDRDIQYGISCKMRGLLNDVGSKGIVSFEVSNASGAFWDALKNKGLTSEDNKSDDLSARLLNPTQAGAVIIKTVLQWHKAVDVKSGGTIDNSNSIFAILQWNGRKLEYRLFTYPFHLPDPSDLYWTIQGRSLRGYRENQLEIEWYGLSGGQLKYYPLASKAKWSSDVFSLEPLPDSVAIGLENRALTYFPNLWPAE